MKNSISLILIVLALALGFFYVRPEYGTVMALRAQKATYNSAISQTKQVKSTSDALLQTYNSISDSNKAELALMIPAKFNLITFTNDLSSLGAKYGMTIKAVSEQNPSSSDPTRTNVVPGLSTGPYQTITVSFTTTAPYPTFLAFLKDLESSRELVDIQSLVISGGGATNGLLTYGVTLNTYAIQQ